MPPVDFLARWTARIAEPLRREFDAEFRAMVDAYLPGGRTSDKHAAVLGRRGGIVSGARRMKNFSAAERKAIATTAALARWHRKAPPDAS